MIESNIDVHAFQTHKSNASEAIAYLKNLDLINSDLKITHVGDQVIIPLLEFPQKIELDFPFELVKHKFVNKENKAQSISQYLQKKIPEVLHMELPTAFDQIGDIAVIDLKDNMRPFASIIGEAILSVHNSVSSVYRKSSKVDGILRLRGIDLIAGVDNTQTIHKEYGLRIFVDISKIYFSPRLATEHRRIALMVKKYETILDMFGGVAPFALHISQLQECDITTLDINPHAPEMIKRTLSMNKQLIGSITIVDGDAKQITQEFINLNLKFDRIIMNHPSDSLSFLPHAISLLEPQGFIHLYLFAPTDKLEEYCVQKINEFNPEIIIINIHKVRQSSPSEFHVCVTLQFP